jgi:AAA family ATP:ADP antiporter
VGQLGLILGTSAVERYSSCAGLGMLLMIGGGLILSIPLLISLFTFIVPLTKVQSAQDVAAKKSGGTGVLEGFRLLMRYPYVAGLFVVTTAYEVIGTIVEYQMGSCFTLVHPSSLDGGAGFAAFKAMNGRIIGFLSLFFALFGAGIFMRKFGLKFCLAAFPIIIGVVVAVSFGFHLMGSGPDVMMWVFFVAVVIFKGLSYALNNPSKEVMYIPTSKDVKFKAKSWIDGIGGRASKGAGALVTGSLGGSLPLLLVAGTGISLGIVALWTMVALYVGNTFNKLQAENKIIG